MADAQAGADAGLRRGIEQAGRRAPAPAAGATAGRSAAGAARSSSTRAACAVPSVHMPSGSALKPKPPCTPWRRATQSKAALPGPASSGMATSGHKEASSADGPAFSVSHPRRCRSGSGRRRHSTWPRRSRAARAAAGIQRGAPEAGPASGRRRRRRRCARSISSRRSGRGSSPKKPPAPARRGRVEGVLFDPAHQGGRAIEIARIARGWCSASSSSAAQATLPVAVPVW